jgi:DNA-binding MarR family transcriptional regulator
VSDNEFSRAIDRVARDCLAMRVRILNRVVTSIYEEALRPLGLKASQMNVLVAVAKLGIAPPTRLCEILQMDASTVSRNVDRMRAKGWLETVPDEDARTQPLRLTTRGVRLLERAVPVWEQGQERAKQLLGREGVALLEKTMRNLGGPAAQ